MTNNADIDDLGLFWQDEPLGFQFDSDGELDLISLDRGQVRSLIAELLIECRLNEHPQALSKAMDAMDRVRLFILVPEVVRKKHIEPIQEAANKFLAVLYNARLNHSRAARETETLLVRISIQEEGEEPAFTQGSNLPDWCLWALPFLHQTYCDITGKTNASMSRTRRGPGKSTSEIRASPALYFVTRALQLFRPETTVSQIEKAWPLVRAEINAQPQT